MADNLFYCPDIGHNPILPEQESQHCAKVLRMRDGDLLTITDGEGQFFDCKLLLSHPKKSMVTILRQWEEPRKRDFLLHIAFSPTKQMDRNEWFVEKATEIGVDRFTPILGSFSERKEIKRERLDKIAIAAMKQSQQSRLPIIDEMLPFGKLVGQPFAGRKFIAHCYDLPKSPLSQSYRKGENALILIGPEGDFSEQEVAEAINNGFEPVSLGDTRLRTETASLVALHTIHLINAITKDSGK
jgi:16S rRNA (uracil1498-N3)-methyltransferase